MPAELRALPTGRAQTAPSSRALRLLLRRLGRWGEMAFSVGALLLFSSALLPLYLGEMGGGSVEGGTGLLRTAYRLAYVGSVALAALHARGVLKAALRTPLVMALVALALTSVFWSVAPDATTDRFARLIATTALGLYLGARYRIPALLDLLALVLGVAVVLSVCVAVAAPEIGIHTTAQGVAGWRGIYTHKNTLGAMATLGILVFTIRWGDRRTRGWVGGACIGLSAVAVVMSRAATALVVTAGTLLLLPLFRALRLRRGRGTLLAIAGVLGGTAAATLVVSSPAVFMETMGRQPTLTGRTTLWSVIIAVGSDRLGLGHGYSAFWTGWQGPSGHVWQATGWPAPHAHNGFLDLWLDLGLAGVIVFALGFAVTLRRAVKLARSTDDTASLWPLVYLAFVVLENIPDSALLNMSAVGLYWVLYVATACAISERREPAPTPRARTTALSLGTRPSGGPVDRTYRPVGMARRR
jgi:exopolysaccharide production protein ExoQ